MHTSAVDVVDGSSNRHGSAMDIRFAFFQVGVADNNVLNERVFDFRVRLGTRHAIKIEGHVFNRRIALSYSY